MKLVSTLPLSLHLLFSVLWGEHHQTVYIMQQTWPHPHKARTLRTSWRTPHHDDDDADADVSCVCAPGVTSVHKREGL